MNNTRRKKLAILSEKLSIIKDELEVVYDEEVSAMERMPDSLECSARYDEMDQIALVIDNAVAALEDIIDDFSEIVDNKMETFR